MKKEYGTINDRILLGYAVDIVKTTVPNLSPEAMADRAIQIWKEKFKELI